MDKNIQKRNELLAQTVINGLESRNMDGYYAKNKEEALKIALELIPEESVVTMGGGMSHLKEEGEALVATANKEQGA